VAELDGKVIGIAGVMHSQALQAFSSMNGEIKKYPRTIVKAVREFRKILEAYGDSPIYAIADEDTKTAPGFLKHVGFKYYRDGVYRWQIQ